jgi:hypothetical protein
MRSSASVTETVSGAESPSGRRRGRRRWVLAGVAVVLVAAGAVVGVARPFAAKSSRSSSGITDNGYPTSLTAVTRRSLSETTQVNATLGKAGSYSVVYQAQGSGGSGSGGSGSGSGSGSGGLGSSGSGAGTFTWLPGVGRVIRQGEVVYRVSDSPAVLLYGRVPAYRSLAEGMTGADVTQLNTDLVTLGYATSTELGSRSGWDYFSGATADAVERLQAHLEVTQTGTLTLGQAVFLPAAIQVTGLGGTTVLGGPATAGSVVVTAASTTPVVTIALDAAQQTEVKAGDHVTVTLPDGATTGGVVSSVSKVATSSPGSGSNGSPAGNSSSSNSANGSSSNGSSSGSSTATITVEVKLSDPKAAGGLDQAPVTVTITTVSVRNALVVPVDALLALSGGGYAVEVAGPGGAHHLVDVTPGLFDDADGLVQVTGSGLAAGQRVVVPGT